MDTQVTGKMTPVHHSSLPSKDTLMPEQVRGCSLTPQPWARTHPAVPHCLMESPQSLQGNGCSA